MVQFSVYTRICSGVDSVQVHKNRLYKALPARGAVRMLVITERQYENIEILLGNPQEQENIQEMEQLMLF